MPTTSSNEFAILNLSDLSSKYKLLKINGLKSSFDDERRQNEYFINRQHLIKKLSFKLKKPVTVIEQNQEPFLVIPENVLIPISQNILGGKNVSFEPVDNTFTLDYTERSPNNDAICLRFLEFLIQTPLYGNSELWQPKSGAPYFNRNPENPEERICHFLGYRLRPVITEDGGIALRVHVTSKFVSRDPVPFDINRRDFERYKKNHFIYRYGHQWYEIAGVRCNDLNVSQYKVTTEDKRCISLLEYAIEASKKPIPKRLSQVRSDTSVLTYFNNNSEERAAIASLCHRVYGPHDADAQRLHRLSIMDPFKRRELAMQFASKFFRNLRFGDIKLQVDDRPLTSAKKMFVVPDFEFGNSCTLSVRGTKGAVSTSLEELGETRLSLLKDSKAGFYSTEKLDRQYFIVPESIKQSWGNQLLDMIKNEVDEFLLQQNGYDPIIVSYNDLVPHTFLAQSRAILQGVESGCKKPGHALVLIHHLQKNREHDEDTLAAMVVKELRDRYDITAAVIHSKTGDECFDIGRNSTGEPEYRVVSGKRGKISGYAQFVALNKVLLLNERSPFTLATKLNADLVIGIDVKANTAGFILIDGLGKNYSFRSKTSKEKEKLRTEQTETYVYELIYMESKAQANVSWKNLVIHRDGRMWNSEIVGIKRAFDRLKLDRILPSDATLTLIEIPKSEIAAFRFFETIKQNGYTKVINPQVGQYQIRGNEGYICTTGRAFRRPGTSLPLHVRKIEGALSIEECLEDIFYLSNLTWTKPNDCCREPITIKLNDRFLKDEATAYDQESLEYSFGSDFMLENEKTREATA